MKEEDTKKRRSSLLHGVAVAALTLPIMVSGPVFAQDQDSSEDADVEEIVVTGSRIKASALTSVAPIQIVNNENIRLSGVANIQDLLLENPVFGTPALSRTNSAFLTSGTGVATVDMRDLGSDRTLVLINSRRVVTGLPGSSIVDLNMIPSAFIERVEILTGGASSLYGSDAVAGVVNFIYKDNFEGIEANAQYGVSQEGDDDTYQANLTIGGNFADGRGNIMTHVGYTKQTGVLSRDRANTFTDDISNLFFTGDPADFGVSREPFFSSGPPQGRFDVNGTSSSGDDWTFDSNGVLRPCFSANGGTAPASCGAFAGEQIGPDGFNRQFFRTIAVPVERYLFATRATYDIADNVTAFMEGTYSSTSSSRQIEPFFFTSGDVFPADARVPIETMVDGVAVLNPIVPTALAAAATDTNGDGLRDIGFTRRIVEFGPRQGGTTRETFRFVVGLEGELWDGKANWDLSYNRGKTTENQFSTGQPNVLTFRQALAGIPDVNDLDNDGSTTDVICADETARLLGCQPVDIFGANSIDPDSIAFLEAGSSFQTDIVQQVLSGNISGELAELPGGALGVAVGFEYRKETSVEELDALTNAGLNAGNALPDTSGQFDVSEAYMEVNIPILSDQPMAHLLGVRGAVRVADYSTVGTVWSYNIGAEWAPVEDIRFRATFARAVRAPNIGELFTGPSETFPPGLVDPCVGIMATGGGTIGDVCRSQPGVLANIADNGGVFTLTQPDLQGIGGFNSGNPDLGEESSDSYTVGAVINPASISGLENLVISVDYFKTTVDDAIVQPPRQFILDQCHSANLEEFCNLIFRRALTTSENSAGSIEFVNAQLSNSGGLEVEGYDVTASYSHDMSGLGLGFVDGLLSAKVSYTHMLEGFVIPVPGADPDPFAGEIGTSKDRFTTNLIYSDGPFQWGITGTYIGRAEEDDQFIAAFGLEPGAISVPAEFYLDTQVSYTYRESVEVFAGIDNAFNNSAPNILTGTSFNVTGTDTAADVYDAIGRRFYIGLRFRM